VFVEVTLRGPLSALEADTALQHTWENLVASPLGKLTSLDQPLAAPRLTHAPDSTRFSVELSLAPLISGLKAAVMSDVWELMKIEKHSTDP
jgi:hypothetical protein